MDRYSCARLILTRIAPKEGINRTLFGGIILDDILPKNESSWQLWESDILINPKVKYKKLSAPGDTLQDILLSGGFKNLSDWCEIV